MLDRCRLEQEASRLVDDGHELQVVPLAERLGVSVSSLYHHVRGRVGIIHAMREVLGEEYRLAPVAQANWEDTVRTSVRTVWNLHGDHPRVLPLLLSVVIDEPATVGFYGVLVDALDSAGIPEDELLSTVETLDAFAFGVALDGLSPNLIFDPGTEESRLGALLRSHSVGRERNQLLFERGLDLLLFGIRERARTAG